MSNELSLLPTDLLQPSKYGTENEHRKIAGGGFLPRLQLFGGNSILCKKGKVPLGTYAVIKGKDNIVHLLGDSVNILILSWRPKAIRFGAENVKSYYNPSHAEFRRIEIDSTQANSGCMYGPEYLIYIPSVNEICSFHFNSITMRQAASGMLPNVGKAVTCKVEFIEKGKFSWHGPVILNCSTPLQISAPNEEFHDLIRGELTKFNNPKEEEELERVEPETADTPSRAH